MLRGAVRVCQPTEKATRLSSGSLSLVSSLPASGSSATHMGRTADDRLQLNVMPTMHSAKESKTLLRVTVTLIASTPHCAKAAWAPSGIPLAVARSEPSRRESCWR